jgi:hypothetical protein
MRRFSLITILLCASMLAGCGIVARQQRQEQVAQAQANAKTAFAECEAKYPAGAPDSVKYAVARNACNTEAARLRHIDPRRRILLHAGQDVGGY